MRQKNVFAYFHVLEHSDRIKKQYFFHLITGGGSDEVQRPSLEAFHRQKI